MNNTHNLLTGLTKEFECVTESWLKCLRLISSYMQFLSKFNNNNNNNNKTVCITIHQQFTGQSKIG